MPAATPSTPCPARCSACNTRPLPSHTGQSGGGELSSGNSPLDPPLLLGREQDRPAAGFATGRAGRRRGAANTITEECERLFCETLRTVFLGERKWIVQDSLEVGSRNKQADTAPVRNRGQSFGSASAGSAFSDHSDLQTSEDVLMQRFGTPSSVASSELDARDSVSDTGRSSGLLTHYLEIWDYLGGVNFKGFTTADKTLFIFFDEGVIGRELKQG